MSEACSVCGVDPTTREGFASVAARTQVIDGKRYCYSCAPEGPKPSVATVEAFSTFMHPLSRPEFCGPQSNYILDIQMKVSDVLERRLDAALKRIEELERDMNDVHTNALSTRGF